MNTKKTIVGFGLLLFVAALALCAFYNVIEGAAAFSIGAGLMATGAIAIPEEVTRSLGEIKDGIKSNGEKVGKLETDQKAASDKLASVEKELEKAQQELDKLRKQFLLRGSLGGATRRKGFITDECALQLGANFLLGNAKAGRLDALGSTLRDSLVAASRTALNIEAKTALTTAEIPLPSTFGSEIRELVAEFGVARSRLMPYPLGGGTSRPPRMGTRPAFGSIAMSVAFTEKSPTFTFASLEPHKLGGIVRVPRELDDQSIIPLGQFLARYGAVEFARAEDTWAFLADGTATYEQVVGIVKACRTLGKTTALGNTKTAPSDAALKDLRALRRQTNSRVLGSGKYYLHPTWEARLRDFNTQADPNVFIMNGVGGMARLDGYEIVWTEVLTPYAETAAADSPIAVFGDLSFWLFGERGMPRTDYSSDVFFATDELAVRFMEEIDFDYLATDAASTLLTAAA